MRVAVFLICIFFGLTIILAGALGYWVYAIVMWLIGGLLTISVIAVIERKNRGGKLYSHMLNDIDESPVPASIGYFLRFATSWLGIPLYILFR